MQRSSGEPALIFPGLAGFYNATSDLWYPLIRVAAGAILVTHGWGKLHAGVAAITASMARSGFEPATAFAYGAITLESLGALCVAIGLFTRFFAAAIAIEMAVIAFIVMMPHGWGRMEFTFLWGIIFLAIALRGGGPYSVDRMIGKEL
ncbi:MAG TPA: DoxX family protein [Pseudolabrys sp.]|uniref:DoxX family protein n=1 Tax=Pseudolabrys sp. TaxID=1960880 RepID=UPI002DDD1F60|nr:DoxX family protein [Pseudolabrys sp.]HEV2628850.1 DoxX family protein [Pseudolabrys sp.]